MKVILPLYACLLFLPSDVTAQRQAPEQKRAIAVQDYFKGSSNLFKICKICDDLFTVNALDCYTDWEGAKQLCTRYVTEQLDKVAKKWNTFPVLELPQGDNFVNGSEKFRDFCHLCRGLFKINDLDCYTNRTGSGQLCRTKFEEALKSTAKDKTVQKRDNDLFSNARSMRKICLVCSLELRFLNYYDCVGDVNGTRSNCRRYASEHRESVFSSYARLVDPYCGRGHHFRLYNPSFCTKQE